MSALNIYLATSKTTINRKLAKHISGSYEADVPANPPELDFKVPILDNLHDNCEGNGQYYH